MGEKIIEIPEAVFQNMKCTIETLIKERENMFSERETMLRDIEYMKRQLTNMNIDPNEPSKYRTSPEFPPRIPEYETISSNSSNADYPVSYSEDVDYEEQMTPEFDGPPSEFAKYEHVSEPFYPHPPESCGSHFGPSEVFHRNEEHPNYPVYQPICETDYSVHPSESDYSSSPDHPSYSAPPPEIRRRNSYELLAQPLNFPPNVMDNYRSEPSAYYRQEQQHAPQSQQQPLPQSPQQQIRFKLEFSPQPLGFR